MKIDIGRLNTNYIGKIATIPLVVTMVYWELGAGLVADVLSGFAPSKQGIESSVIVDVPLVLIIVGVWLSRHRLFLYLGRIGTIIWLLPFGFYSVMVLGEFEHTDPIIWIEYPILLLSTMAVTLCLWKRVKKEGEHEDNPR